MTNKSVSTDKATSKPSNGGKKTKTLLFKRAKKAYKDIIGTYTKMLNKTTVKMDKKLQLEYKNRHLAYFDALLSDILLHVSLADGEITEAEIEFIENLCEFGDVLGLVSSKLELEGLNYNSLNSLNEEGLELVINLIDNIVSDSTDFVIKYLAKYDIENDDIDVLNTFRAKTELIGSMLAKCEGRQTVKKTRAIKHAIIKLLFLPFRLI